MLNASLTVLEKFRMNMSLMCLQNKSQSPKSIPLCHIKVPVTTLWS